MANRLKITKPLCILIYERFCFVCHTDFSAWLFSITRGQIMGILNSMSDSLQDPNQRTLTQGTTTAQSKNINQAVPSMAQNVTNNLNSNSLLMKSAAQKGNRMAAQRGLQNSTIGIESAQRAMLDAAIPIAQQDTQNQQQITVANLNAKLSHDNAMKELGAQVSANTIGKSIDYAMQITNNFDAQIAGVLNNTQMKEGDKKKAIEQLKASRDTELSFMSRFMQKIPTTQKDWAAFPSLGVPTITMKPTETGGKV